MPLNYYAINKVLGGTMVPASRQRFGGFHVLQSAGELLRHRPRKPAHVQFSYDMDGRVAQAFEDVRNGTAPERVLWDDKLATRFHRRCRELGVHAPSAQLDRRLITIRKNVSRYRKHGIELSPTTVTDPQPSVVPQYAHILEFALVKLRNRYGASIDDILLEPELTDEYEQIARKVAGTLTSAELRLGALYIRKTRHVARKEQDLFDELDASHLESKLERVDSLERTRVETLPADAGLLEVLEGNRFLYISRSENLQAIIREFVQGSTLEVMSNHFWTPTRESISLRYFVGDSFERVSIHRWQLKLIQAHDPVFNWPIAA